MSLAVRSKLGPYEILLLADAPFSSTCAREVLREERQNFSLDPFGDPVMSKNSIRRRDSSLARVRVSQSSSCSRRSSQRSTNIEWNRYSNHWLNVSKLRSTGQVEGRRYQPFNCSSKISPHTSRR